jgi:hypothetical protein
MEATTTLERLIPVPRRRQREHVDLAAPPERIWKLIRHTDLARTPMLRTVMGLGALLGRAPGQRLDTRFCIDDFRPTPSEPGFRILADTPPLQFAVAALARVSGLRLSFVHFSTIDEFVTFAEPRFIKLAASATISPHASRRMGPGSRLSFELRIGATDDAAWRGARWYFGLIGPGLRWVQRHVLGSLADELGWPTPHGKPADPAIPPLSRARYGT